MTLSALSLIWNSRADSSNIDTQTIWSPNHWYCCQIQTSDVSDQIISFKRSPDRKPEKLLSTSRWAQVLWSPDDGWFCIDNHSDTHSNQLHVYHVFKHGNGTPVLIWSSPNSGPDAYWEMLGWRMSEGTIKIKCHYARDYWDDTKGWLTKIYYVPILLPGQVEH
jgi:hypothetical protein